MRAEFRGTGLFIRLVADDKEKLKETGQIECRLQSWKKPKLIFHVVDEVPKKRLEEPGFHMDVLPSKVGPEYRHQYDIYLSKERFNQLTNPKDPIIKGGYFVSRSRYDRIDILYFGI